MLVEFINFIKGDLMKLGLHITLTLAMILFIPSQGACEIQAELMETITDGEIDWTNWVIRAKGRGTPSEKVSQKPLASSMALKTAQIAAYENLLKAIQDIRIESNTNVKNILVADEKIRNQVHVMSRKAQLVKKEYMSDSGTVEVTIEMSLKNGFSQLILPRNIKQIEPIKTTSPTPSNNSATTNGSNLYTGLVIDARGLNILPAMSIRLLDEKGQEVYGPAYASREYAVQQGMSKYLKSMASAVSDKRVADNPLIVKGLKTGTTSQCDIVISNTDVSKLLSASENLFFLKECRVIIVRD